MNVESAARINLRWIVRLRWGAVGGQIITILLAGRFLDSPLPRVPMSIETSESDESVQYALNHLRLELRGHELDELYRARFPRFASAKAHMLAIRDAKGPGEPCSLA